MAKKQNHACACIGNIGNDPYCPCLMEQYGLKTTITESYISPEVFQVLSDADKTTINDLKCKAVIMYIGKSK